METGTMDDFEVWEAELSAPPAVDWVYVPGVRPQWSVERPTWAPSPYAQPDRPRHWWSR